MEQSKISIVSYRITAAISVVMMILYNAWLTYIQEYIQACIFTIVLAVFIRQFVKEWDAPRQSQIGSNCLLIAMLIYYGYREYTKHNRQICADKYGIVFNKTRMKIGAPFIPANWHIISITTQFVDWGGKEIVIGHIEKSINIDSTCKINSEYDDYSFKPLHGISREMHINTKYAKGRSMDSVIYYYSVGNRSKRISHHVADSIFTAEGIKKD